MQNIKGVIWRWSLKVLGILWKIIIVKFIFSHISSWWHAITMIIGPVTSFLKVSKRLFFENPYKSLSFIEKLWKVVNSSKVKLMVYIKNEAFVNEIEHTLSFLFQLTFFCMWDLFYRIRDTYFLIEQILQDHLGLAMVEQYTVWKVSLFGVFLVHILKMK